MQTRMMAAVSWGIEMAAIKPRAIKFVIGPNTRDRRDVIARDTLIRSILHT
jgi:multisubunit Na+/H+ antiporter MnhF subunit